MIVWFYNTQLQIFFLLNHPLLSAEGVTAPLALWEEEAEQPYPSQLWAGRQGRKRTRAAIPCWVWHVGLWMFTKGFQSTRRGRSCWKSPLPSSKVFIYLLCHLLGFIFLLVELEENLFHYLLGCCSFVYSPEGRKLDVSELKLWKINKSRPWKQPHGVKMSLNKKMFVFYLFLRLAGSKV